MDRGSVKTEPNPANNIENIMYSSYPKMPLGKKSVRYRVKTTYIRTVTPIEKRMMNKAHFFLFVFSVRRNVSARR